MLGAAASSFVKHRLGTATSSRATGLDQIPEALVPLLLVQARPGLTPAQIAIVTLVFFAMAIPRGWLSNRWGLRDRPC